MSGASLNHSAQAEFAERLTRLQATRAAEAAEARAAKKEAGRAAPKKVKSDGSALWFAGFVLTAALAVGGTFVLTRHPVEPGAEAPGLVASVMGLFGGDSADTGAVSDELAAVDPSVAEDGAKTAPQRLVLDSQKSE